MFVPILVEAPEYSSDKTIAVVEANHSVTIRKGPYGFDIFKALDACQEIVGLDTDYDSDGLVGEKIRTALGLYAK